MNKYLSQFVKLQIFKILKLTSDKRWVLRLT